MIEAPRSAIKQDAYDMPNVLSSQGMTDIGLDARTMGSSE
jgi:hypothetical protein